MLQDRYENALSTTSTAARDHYVIGLDRILGAEPDIVAAFEAAVKADPGFALAHVGLARARQMAADVPGARKSVALARSLTGGISQREASHINVMGLLTGGRSGARIRVRFSCDSRTKLGASHRDPVRFNGGSRPHQRQPGTARFIGSLLAGYAAETRARYRSPPPAGYSAPRSGGNAAGGRALIRKRLTRCNRQPIDDSGERVRVFQFCAGEYA